MTQRIRDRSHPLAVISVTVLTSAAFTTMTTTSIPLTMRLRPPLRALTPILCPFNHPVHPQRSPPRHESRSSFISARQPKKSLQRTKDATGKDRRCCSSMLPLMDAQRLAKRARLLHVGGVGCNKSEVDASKVCPNLKTFCKKMHQHHVPTLTPDAHPSLLLHRRQ